MQLPWSLATSSQTAGSGLIVRSASEPSPVSRDQASIWRSCVEFLLVVEKAGGPARALCSRRRLM